MKTRHLDDRVETYEAMFSGACRMCGQKIMMVTESSCTHRADRRRYYYPGETSAWGIFRCKRCQHVIDETFDGGNIVTAKTEVKQ